MRVSDYIVRYLADHGIGHVFMVTGGAAMHLNDAFGRESKIKEVFCHHEQPCAIALETHAQLNRRFKRDHLKSEPMEVKDASRYPPLPLKGIFDYQQWTISLKREEYHSYNVGSD